MVDWRAWPEENARLAASGSLPDWTRTPELKNEASVALRTTLLTMVATVVLTTFITGLLLARFAPSGTGGTAAAIVLGGVVVLLASLLTTALWAEARIGRRRVGRTLEVLAARGEARLGEEIVGVAYADRLWHDPVVGEAWDWGALRLEPDRLSFVGRSSHFDLRREHLVRTEVRRSEGILGPRARLYLMWKDGVRTETLSLELPFDPSRRRRIEAIADLRQRIERWRGEPFPRFGSESIVLPFRFESLEPGVDLCALTGRRAGRTALRVVALFWLAGVTLITLAGMRFRFDPIPLTSLLWMPSVFLWILTSKALGRRTERREDAPSKTVAAKTNPQTRSDSWEHESRIETR